MDIAGYDFATDVGKETIKTDLIAAITSQVDGMPIVYHGCNSTIVAHRWIRPAETSFSSSPASDKRPLIIKSNDKTNYFADHPLITAQTIIPFISSPINPLTAAPELVCFPVLPSTSASAINTSTSTNRPESAPCAHVPHPFDRLLTGAAAPVQLSTCLDCFPALVSSIAAEAAPGMPSARWDELHAYASDSDDHDAETAKRHVQALMHVREIAGSYVSDAWLHALQQAGIILGAESPTSPMFASSVADTMVARVSETHGVPMTSAIEDVRVTIVGYALKDVACAMLHKVEAFREGAVQRVVEAAVDLAMSPKFAANVPHGEMRPWDLLLAAFNEVWTGKYLALEHGFETLASAEEREWASQYEAKEVADASQPVDCGSAASASQIQIGEQRGQVVVGNAVDSRQRDDGFGEEGMGMGVGIAMAND
ncbi:hypothetical protein BCR44DRAFT_40353, partial [Catenaria anguillulae PL171]